MDTVLCFVFLFSFPPTENVNENEWLTVMGYGLVDLGQGSEFTASLMYMALQSIKEECLCSSGGS